MMLVERPEELEQFMELAGPSVGLLYDYLALKRISRAVAA